MMQWHHRNTPDPKQKEGSRGGWSERGGGGRRGRGGEGEGKGR